MRKGGMEVPSLALSFVFVTRGPSVDDGIREMCIGFWHYPAEFLEKKAAGGKRRIQIAEQFNYVLCDICRDQEKSYIFVCWFRYDTRLVGSASRRRWCQSPSRQLPRCPWCHRCWWRRSCRGRPGIQSTRGKRSRSPSQEHCRRTPSRCTPSCR